MCPILGKQTIIHQIYQWQDHIGNSQTWYLPCIEDSSGTEGIAGVPVGEDMSQSCSPGATGPSTIGQAARSCATTDEPKHCKFDGWSWTSGQLEFQYIPLL